MTAGPDFWDALHDQRAETNDRQAIDDARQYALDTLRLADPEPAKPRTRRGPRPPGPRWGNDIPDPLNSGLVPTEAEYLAAVRDHTRKFPW